MPLQSSYVVQNNNQQLKNVSIMPINNNAEIHHSLKAGPVSGLQLSNRLHSTLDLQKLFDIYSDSSKQYVKYDSLSYSHPDKVFSYDQGVKKAHSCNYRLLMGGNNLGEIEFTRRKKFTDKETIKLEYLLSALLNPLHNGLMYRQAVNSSLLDPLTSINNRAAYNDSINKEISLANRHQNPLAMIVLDIDHFKSLNDNYGHLFGDCVLRDIAKCISEHVRDSDMVFRYGGEEFIILLRNTCEQGANLLAERIRTAISQIHFKYGDHSTRATASLGIACLKHDELEHDLFKRADDALYTAKDEGRNRSVVAL